MVILGEVEISEVQRHEEATAANARLGGYGMDAHCPTNDFRCFRVLLEQGDADRLFVLADFSAQTTAQSCRMRDLVPGAVALPRVASFVTAGVDLRSRTGLELVLVCGALHDTPLIVIDGNHRAIHQFLTQGSMQGVRAYACVHRDISQWPFVPRLARTDTSHGQ